MASQGRQPRTHAGSGGGRSVLAALMRVRGERADADGHHGRAREGPRGTKKQRRHQNCCRGSSTLNFPKIGKFLDLSALYKSALNESFSGWPAFALTFCSCLFLCQKCAKIRVSDPHEEGRRSSNSGRPHACTPCASPISCAALSWPFPPCRGVALTPSAAAARKAV